MRIIACEQGSPEWQRAHIGRPSASQFHRIMTPKTLKPSASQERYIADLLAGWALDMPLDERVTQFMERGMDLEAKAVEWYELVRDEECEKVGFILHDTLEVGCSPDRLVWEDGLLEVKCPSAAIHLMYVLGFDSVIADYRLQAQGQLWLTGRSWIDCLSYHPDLPPSLNRYERDEEVIAALEHNVFAFLRRLDGAKAACRKFGVKRDEAA